MLRKVGHGQGLFQGNVTTGIVSQRDGSDKVLELLRVKLQYIKQDFPLILLHALRMLLEIRSNHDKETIRPKPTTKVLVVPFGGENILDDQNNSLKEGVVIEI